MSHTWTLLRRHRTAVIVAAILICAALISGGIRWTSSGFRWHLFASTLSQVEPRWTAAALIAMLLTYLGRALRWRVMMAPLRRAPKLPGLVSATAVGFTAIVFFGRPGEFVRPWLIATRERVPFSSQLAVWFLERIFDLLSVILLFGFALTTLRVDELGPKVQAVAHAGGYVALAAGTVCVVTLILSARYSATVSLWGERLSRHVPGSRGQEWVSRNLHSFLSGMRTTGSAGSMLRIAAYTTVEWAVIAASMFCVFKSFGPTSDLGWSDALVFTGFVAFGSAVQLPAIGGGMQVAAVLILTELFALPLESATACALLVWAATWLTVVPFGLMFAFAEGLQWSQLRRVREAAQTSP